MDYKKEMMNEEMVDHMEKMELFLRRIPGVLVQFSNAGDLLYQSLSWQYTPQIKEKALTVWESLMDTAVVIKPVLVENHNTSEKEICVQDDPAVLKPHRIDQLSKLPPLGRFPPLNTWPSSATEEGYREIPHRAQYFEVRAC